MDLRYKYAEEIFDECGVGTSIDNIAHKLSCYVNDLQRNKSLTELQEIVKFDTELDTEQRKEMIAFLEGMKK